MRPPTSASLSDASAKGYELLRRWEEVAPLDFEQLAAIDAVARQTEARRLPVHLTPPPAVSDAPSKPEASFSEVETAVLQSTQDFYQWHAKLEALRISEAEQEYQQYAGTLATQLQTCQDASQLIHGTLTGLNSSIQLYKDAVGRSRSLRETGETLLQEQEQFSAFAEAIRDRLRPYEELESIATEFHSVASSLDTADLKLQSASIFKRFLAILSKLDDCISYVATNPHYAESASYETRFRQLHGRALAGILHRLREILKASVKEIAPQPHTQSLESISEAEQTNNYYIKFRALVEEQLQAVLGELASRNARHEYIKLYGECQLAFCRVRVSLMLDLVRRRATELLTSSLETFLRDGFTYLVHICRDEYQLFLHFFPGAGESTAAVTYLMESLGTVLYDNIRPRLIAVQSLDQLCDCVTILKTEVIDDQIEQIGDAMDTLRSVVLRTIADAQERLIFRAQAFIEEKIDRHEPTGAEITELQLPSSVENTGGDELNAEMAEQETWYVPLRLAVNTLKKLHEALEPGVFGGIAHNTITVCALSINKAVPIVSRVKSAVDGQLFAIRHLLILREELIRFRMEFQSTEKDLDFTHMRDHMRRVLSGEVSVFQLPASSMAGLVTWTAPRVTNTQIDSKKRLEKQLKESCEAFIMTVTKVVVEPMLAFLTKVAPLLIDRVMPHKSISRHAFASVERLVEMVDTVNHMLESSLPELITKMKIYLPQRGTFDTLYKPIKTNIIDAHSQVSAVLEQDYSDMNTSHIELRSRDQLTYIMDTLQRDDTSDHRNT